MAPSLPTAPRHRGERGALFPSPVVILSVIAVVMAAVTFIATRGSGPTEREITPAARTEASAPAVPTATADPTDGVTGGATLHRQPRRPAIRRGQVYVEVYNNSTVTGLASRVAARATGAGWNVVGADNWYGTIPTSTVYYPARLERAAKVLAADLGVRRTAPAVAPMRMDRLTLILTAPLA